MASHSFKPPLGALEQDVVTLYATAVMGTSGAVASSKGGGVASVVKNGAAGNYTVTLSSQYYFLLSATANVVLGTIAAVLPNAQVFETPATLQADFRATNTVTFQFVDAAGAAANPDSGAVLQFRIEVRNSTVGPFD